MAKRPDVPVVIEERQAFTANRFDVTGYTVSVDALMVTIFVRASDEDGVGGKILDSRMQSRTVDEVGAQQRLMPAAGRITILTALAAVQVDQKVIDAVTAALDAHPEMGATAYYEGTRQALYAEV